MAVSADGHAPNMPKPTTLAELIALLPAEDRARVRLQLTPELVRQVLTHNQPAAPIAFGGLLPTEVRAQASDYQDWYRLVRVRAVTHVAELAHIIASGQWDPEFEPTSNGAILFTPHLQIGNGRHRLKAVDLADRPITVYIERCAWGPHQGPPLGPAC